ncbi:MAG TPA: hypothetical protein VGI10_00285 [Polyangiaceae bacterium]
MKGSGVRWVLVAAVASWLMGCGSDSSSSPAPAVGCSPGVSVCVTDTIGTVCPKDGSGQLAFSCGSGQTCQGGACVEATCTTGSQECVGDSVLRVCATDGSWVPVACSASELCYDGKCVSTSDAGTSEAGAPEAGTGCTPGKKECADTSSTRECSADGSTWTVVACAANEQCSGGECSFDPNSPCAQGSTQCQDATTLYRCKPDRQGYELVSCPATAPCTDGACKGTVCNAGETKCEPIGSQMSNAYDHVLKCTDGTAWDSEPCNSNQECAYDLDRSTLDQDVALLNAGSRNIELPAGISASCHVETCAFALGFTSLPYAFSCGDPADLSVDTVHSYSWCLSAPPIIATSWLTYQCGTGQTCDDQTYGCTGGCTPGDTQCGGHDLADGDQVESCGADGTWGDPVSCPAEQACGFSQVNVGPGGGHCMASACAYWRAWTGLPYTPPPLLYGQCDPSGKILPCLSDGTLGAPEDCPLPNTCIEGYATPDGQNTGSCGQPPT